MVDDIVNEKFKTFKEDLVHKKEVLKDFIDILPNTSTIKSNLQNFLNQPNLNSTLKNFIDSHLKPGFIDVNIMNHFLIIYSLKIKFLTYVLSED
ncbi:hypothetical protein ACFOWU_05140 [Epilithonimonas zeae]|uniref:hypothetical protein n=1 Tax=Epilithonimonas zeae TaxID=1416779 RepID=UPI00094109EE|nr:hypothetical protein [Epilithonimonas zeae]